MVARLGCNLEEAKETLQLFDILRGGQALIAVVCSAMGAKHAAKMCGLGFQRRG